MHELAIILKNWNEYKFFLNLGDNPKDKILKVKTIKKEVLKVYP